jgi:hypothetical protein
MSSDRELTPYLGGAGGSAQKALRELEIPNVLISYATRNNRPWDAIERLAVDSGGFSVISSGRDYEQPLSAYLEYLEEHEGRLEWFAFRDYPCATALLDRWDRSVAEHQRLTTESAIELVGLLEERPLEAEGAAVLQGTEPREYLEHMDQLADHGILEAVPRLAIGSLVKRDVATIRRIVTAVAGEAPADIKIHGFGVGREELPDDAIRGALDSVDSCAYERTARNDAGEGVSCDWEHVLRYARECWERLEELATTPATTRQQRLTELNAVAED